MFSFIREKFENLVKTQSHFVPPSERIKSLIGSDFNPRPQKKLKSVATSVPINTLEPKESPSIEGGLNLRSSRRK